MCTIANNNYSIFTHKRHKWLRVGTGIALHMQSQIHFYTVGFYNDVKSFILTRGSQFTRSIYILSFRLVYIQFPCAHKDIVPVVDHDH